MKQTNESVDLELYVWPGAGGGGFWFCGVGLGTCAGAGFEERGREGRKEGRKGRPFELHGAASRGYDR